MLHWLVGHAGAACVSSSSCPLVSAASADPRFSKGRGYSLPPGVPQMTWRAPKQQVRALKIGPLSSVGSASSVGHELSPMAVALRASWSGAVRADEGTALQVSGDEQSALTALWRQRWPDCEPVGHRLKDVYRDVWVRFHSLPGSKRYPDGDAEYAVLLDRYDTVLDEPFRRYRGVRGPSRLDDRACSAASRV